MKIIELFSGIGGFTKGFIDAGYEIEEHYFSEIDKHAIANYKNNFPHAKHIGSVVDFRPRDFKGIDVITFGSPCQDFSLAGKRKGLEGSRSSLIEYAIKAIIDIRPSVFIWENVKGAFSSNSGADFWAILQAFANIGGYRIEWQLLNTKWFLPQNRERIYLVGHLAGRSIPGVFPIGENDELHSERRQIKKETNSVASTLMAGHHKSQTGNFLLCDSGKGRSLEKRDIMPPLRANTGAGHGNYVVGTWRDYKGEIGVREMNDNLCPTLLARARADGSGQPVLVIQKTGGYGITVKENETGTLQAGGANVMDKVPNVIIPYSMGNAKPGRSCINAQRIPEIGNEEKSIRRLTEIECERLQGFPDNWTEYGNYDGTVKKIPKTQRYKMLGNAVTVKVVEVIAKRINL